ncbi:c-type cytochrome [Marinimicrobium sp. ARAG 43.8]|uniref:c-type cytochrome n=1 Tax=Marinimicrobium sp. ARAG 43.8 TaxID=3418719 RepID=UPI003CF70C16
MKDSVKHLLLALSILVWIPVASAAGDPQAGAEKVAVCAACHGQDGNSPAPTFPKLAGLGEAYLYKQLQDIQAWSNASGADKETTGRAVPQMTGMLSGLNDQDLQDIAAFYASQTIQLTGAQEMQVRVNSGEQVDGLALGERIYRAGNPESGVPACMGCHLPNGHGNPPAGFPRLSGQYPEYIETQLRAFRAGERTNDGDSMMMRMAAKHLSDYEIEAVANYIGGLN